MNRLKLLILLILAFSIRLSAQNVVHLCIGDNHNFGVPDNPTSLAYNWFVSDSSLATIDSGNGTHHILIDLNNTGVFQLLVEEIDANGCSGYDSILVEIHNLPNPNIFAIGPTSFCEGDSVRLQVDSVYVSHIWNNGDTLIYTYGDTSTNYFINVTDTNGCSNNSNSIIVDAHPNPFADFIVNGVCVNSSTTFINQSSIISDSIVTKIWYLGNGIIRYGDSVTNIYSAIGDYYTKLFVMSDFGCKDSTTKLFSIFGNPIAEFEHIPHSVSTIQPEMNFINTTMDLVSVSWDMDGDTSGIYLYETSDTSQSPYYQFEDPGLYNITLTVRDANQCIDSIIHKIIMYYDFVFYMPNSFTPNGDKKNDAFGPKGLRMHEYVFYEFAIYNQWGEEIFITNKVPKYDLEGECIKNCWNGDNAPNGVYSWVVLVKDELGKSRKEIGNFTIVR